VDNFEDQLCALDEEFRESFYAGDADEQEQVCAAFHLAMVHKGLTRLLPPKNKLLVKTATSSDHQQAHLSSY